jgi:mRNA interferase HigB
MILLVRRYIPDLKVRGLATINLIKADWSSPQQIKEKFRNVSIVGDNRVIFNIKGNDYRLIVKINYPHRLIYIRFVGTHKQYDTVEATQI